MLASVAALPGCTAPSAAQQRARSRRAVSCRAGGGAPEAPRRTVLALAAALLLSAAPPRAGAFGVGFPGYDLNVDARKRAGDRNKAEAAEQKA